MDEFGLNPEEVFNLMYDKIENTDYVVGHNILGFDIYLMYEYYKAYGKSPKKIDLSKFIDTNCLAKAVKGSLVKNESEPLINFQFRALNIRLAKGEKTKLGVLGKEYDVPHDYENLHNAIVDLELNKKVYDILKYKIDI
jgi:DNA polymerase III epsilon subunit-like protein